MKLFLVLLLPVCFAASAQESLVAPPLPAVAASQGAGLNLTFTSGGKSDARPARLAALFVPAGQAPTPFLAAGPFTARFEGALRSELRADCTFAAELSGTLKMTLNGEEVLAGAADGTKRLTGRPVKLNKGANQLVIEFQSPATGDAWLRLLWFSPEFFPEPVPPTLLEREAGAADVRAGERVREGRLLFAQRRCAQCHEAAALLPPRGEGMPELMQDAPVFAEFGARFKEEWMAHWINDPHAIRPGTPMPRVFAGKGDEIDPRAADLAAFLSSIGTPAEAKPPGEDLIPLGGALFANLGCIACHTTPEYDGADEFHRVPLGHVRAKWQPAALSDYLKDPQKIYQWTRMPNFHLTDEEAAKLTAFLLSGNQKELAAAPKGDAARGGMLAATAGCLNCHAGVPPTTAPKLADTFAKKWQTGCLAAEPAARGAAPDFAFTPAQREALVAFAAAGFDSLKRDPPAEFAQRQSVNLRCNACHALDAAASAWSQLENDIAPLTAAAPPEEGEGRPIGGATAPLFTWLGEKLRPRWAADFIAGRNPVKPRPWIIARMPSFATYADGLAAGLAHQHGFSAAEPPKLAADPEKAKAGETLLGEAGGFNCITCHGVGERKPTQVFEAPGINLALTAGRLRSEYYLRWVLFPQRIDPETKMTKFADEQGKTPLTQLFDGDANRQYDAIWHDLQAQFGTK
ncbi:MAG TPA: c-type cytochrome [Chthoniobacteraceae bacterium]|jgi:cytochrome c2|nr:c-type cytochrome [Chthoniobacteraceae bacterium]